MKRQALQNKQVGVLRMAFRARKVFGTFEKRAPGACFSKVPNLFGSLSGATIPLYLRNAEVLSLQTSQSFLFFLY